jgi:GT2 family glycosyltransferase
MLRRTLQRLVRLSPGVVRAAWRALPQPARSVLSPLVHPIAAGTRTGAEPLAVDAPAAGPPRFDVVVSPGFDLPVSERTRLESAGHRVVDLGTASPSELAGNLGLLDAVLLSDDASADATRAARRLGWRFSRDPARLEEAFPEVTVVVPTHAARQLCRSCLHALTSYTAWGRLRVVVVDDASSDGTDRMLSEVAAVDPRISVVRLDQRRGFAAACNAGIERATGEYLVLLNDDTVVSRGWLARLVAHLESDPEIGMVGPVTNQIGNEAKIETHYGSLSEMLELAAARSLRHAGERFVVPTLALFCAAMRLDLLRELGSLDERFGIGMFEDDDLSMSLDRRGLKLAVARDAFVHHVGQATLGKLDDSAYLALWEENKKRFEDKWGRAWRPPASGAGGR